MATENTATDNPSTATGVAETDMILELRGVSVHFGAVVALERVTLGVGRGELAAVMGPNGAGKSTVLKAIMGLVPVVGGQVFWRGSPLLAATHDIVKQGISFVPQGRRVFTHLSVMENLELGCLYLNDRTEQSRRPENVAARSVTTFPWQFLKSSWQMRRII